ncbi:MAG: hypothetical protein ACYTBX_04915 [Planctomycetota bacterium]|jgi:hypothetical protein
MNELLTQIILARNGDPEGWMNILVVVAIAIVYGLSSILKAKSKKPSEKEEQEEPLGRKPGSKLKEIAERFQKELSELSRERMYEPPQRSEGIQKESFQQARRPAGPTPGRPYRPGVQQPRAKVAAARRAVEKFAAEAERPRRLQSVEPLAEPELSLPSSKVQADFEELPEFTSKAVKGLGALRGGIPGEVPEAEHLPEILSDYADPDELRRAILHYEILGRPLSLRDPSGQIIGL